MAFKIISLILAFGALGFFILRAMRSASGEAALPARRNAAAVDLVVCKRCGAYHPAGALCRCRRTPTP
ncbi:MAG: hypothetical protein AAGM38_13205 [Pseudomonadota bacterium]